MLANTDTVNSYVGNGATSSFPYSFRLLSSADLQVVLTLGGIESSLELGTNYTLDGVGAENGGSVTLLGGPLAAGAILTLRRSMALTQPFRFTDQGKFLPSCHEAAFDRLTMLLQQVARDAANPTGVVAVPVPPNYTTATRPAPVRARLGMLIYIQDPGVPGQLQACLQAADGTAQWVILSPGGF